jgi:hypothetical protein
MDMDILLMAVKPDRCQPILGACVCVWFVGVSSDAPVIMAFKCPLLHVFTSVTIQERIRIMQYVYRVHAEELGR